jgi:hypothetical protein
MDRANVNTVFFVASWLLSLLINRSSQRRITRRSGHCRFGRAERDIINAITCTSFRYADGVHLPLTY